MNWTIFITSITGGISCSAVVLFLLPILFKKYIGILFDKELEKYKSDLRKLTYEHEVRFYRLYEKRAEIVSELYKKITMVDSCFKSRLNAFQGSWEKSLEEKEKDAGKSAQDLIDYYYLNKIFFEESLCLEIDSLIGNLRNILIDLFIPKMISKEEQNKAWIEQSALFYSKIPPILKRIENQMKEMLGINFNGNDNK